MPDFLIPPDQLYILIRGDLLFCNRKKGERAGLYCFIFSVFGDFVNNIDQEYGKNQQRCY